MITSLYQTQDGALRQGLGDEELRAAVRSAGGMLWMDFHQPNAEELFKLDEIFGFHPLAIEDCQHTSQYPKLDDFGDHLFLVFLVPNPQFDPNKEYEEGQEEEPVKELDLFLGANYVVTMHATPLPFVQRLLERTRRDPKRLLRAGPSFLVHDLLDAAVDQFFVMVEKFQNEAEEMEDQLQEQENEELLGRVFELKRRVLNLRRQMGDHRELILRLIRGDQTLVKKNAHIYFRNLQDHLDRIVDDLDICRDTLNSARDVHLAMANTRTNQVMKVLTVFFALSLPFTVASGWYGMNFTNLPLKNVPEGPWIMSSVMVAIAGLILFWLHRKGWL